MPARQPSLSGQGPFDAAFIAGVRSTDSDMVQKPCTVYIGEDTFIPHFFRLFRMKHIYGTVVFGPLLYGEDTCAQARQWIDDEQTKTVLISATNEPH